MTAKPAAPTVAYSYVRFSSAEQRKGDSLRRQTEAAADWCVRNNARLDASTTLHDLGKSAFRGGHRKNPDRNALAAFLKLVEDGKVARGSFLIIESLDRLTREHIRPALTLLLNLIESGVAIVQLKPVEVVYDENVEPMTLMMALMELSRGNSESQVKSQRIGAAWSEKKKDARNGKLLTRQLPAWITLTEAGEMVLVPERAEAVRTIFELASSGYGVKRILGKLTKDGVPPIGTGGHWVKGYVGRILRDRRAIGELQPRKRKNHERDDAPIVGYFPPAVSQEMFYAARAGAAERGKYRGRLARQIINPFAGLLKNGLEGDSYCLSHLVQSRKRRREGQVDRYAVLINHLSDRGTSPCRSFSFPVFERAIISCLREVTADEVIGRGKEADEVIALEGELAWVSGRIEELKAELRKGNISAMAEVLRESEEQQREIEAKLETAKGKAAKPLAESWSEMKTLMDVLADADDPDDVRLRLRSALRRNITSIWLVVVARGKDRLCAVQIYFADGQRCRSYLIFSRPARSNGKARKEGYWRCWSLAEQIAEGDLDLRRPDHARRLASALEVLDVDALTGDGGA